MAQVQHLDGVQHRQRSAAGGVPRVPVPGAAGRGPAAAGAALFRAPVADFGGRRRRLPGCPLRLLPRRRALAHPRRPHGTVDPALFHPRTTHPTAF